MARRPNYVKRIDQASQGLADALAGLIISRMEKAVTGRASSLRQLRVPLAAAAGSAVPRKRPPLSAEARRKISEAQKRRWARHRRLKKLKGR